MRRLLAAALVITALLSCSCNSPSEALRLPEQVGRFKLMGKSKTVGDPVSSKLSIEITLKPPAGTTAYDADYKSPLGEFVMYQVIVFPTAWEAEEWVGFHKGGDGVLERGPKLDPSGKRIGRRVVEGYKDGVIMISWSEGARAYSLLGDQKPATEFEGGLLSSRAE